MPAVMEQIGKMSRTEQIRLVHLILDAIENGTTISGSLGTVDVSNRIGLMEGQVRIPSYERDLEMDEEIIAGCDFEVEPS